MKILAVNGSPRGNTGNTQVILEKFLQGCRRPGVEEEIVYLKDKHIEHCIGCFKCWTKTPGKCIHEDDMEELLVKIQETDIMVYATPLYYFTVTGIMKDFMDRMLPLIDREIIKLGKSYVHPPRFKRKTSVKSILISNCGFPGRYNFSGLVETFKVMTNGNLAAAILCTQGAFLRIVHKDENLKKLYAPFFSSLESAGQQIVEQGYINDETLAILDKDVIEPEVYVNMSNNSWH